MPISASNSAGAAANPKLTNEFDTAVTTPRRRSNHCETIVRDDRVSRPWPVNRRHPKPALITTRPTNDPIGPTKLNIVTVAASPRVAPRATRRAPYRSIARPPAGSRNPLQPVPIR